MTDLLWFVIYWLACFAMMVNWLSKNGHKIGSFGEFVLIFFLSLLLPFLTMCFMIARVLTLNKDKDEDN